MKRSYAWGALISLLLVFSLSSVAKAGEVWVTNQGAEFNNVAIIDTDKLKLVTTISAGKKPHNIVFSRDGRFAYVANVASGDISVIDAAARRVVATVPAGKRAHGLTVGPAGKTLWVANVCANTVTVFEGADRGALKRVATIRAGKGTALVNFSHDGKKAYVSNGVGGTTSVVDVASRRVIGEITTGKGAMGLEVYKGRVFETDGGDNKITVIDTATDKIVATLRFGHKEPHGIAIIPNSGRAVIANRKSQNLSIVNLESLQELYVIKVAERPDIVVVSPDGKTAFFTSRGGKSMGAVDLFSRTVLGYVGLGGDPHGIAYRP